LVFLFGGGGGGIGGESDDGFGGGFGGRFIGDFGDFDFLCGDFDFLGFELGGDLDGDLDFLGFDLGGGLGGRICGELGVPPTRLLVLRPNPLVFEFALVFIII
jgi:hypothetical protein